MTPYTALKCLKTMKLLKDIAFARGGAHLPIAQALRLLSTQELRFGWKKLNSKKKKKDIAFARGGAHLPIAHALRLLSTQDEIEIEKK